MIADSKTKGMMLTELVAFYCDRRDMTPGSVRQLGAVVRSLEKWAGRSVYVSELADDPVNEWVSAMLTNGIARATARSHRDRLLTLWRAAYRLDLHTIEPKHIRLVKLPFKAPMAWSVDEVRKILGAAESLWRPFAHSDASRRDYWSLAVRLAWDTALRMRDLMALKKADFDEKRIAVVTQSKTGRWHTVRIHESTYDLMRRFVPSDDRVLARSMTESNFQDQFKRIVKTAGLKGPWKKIRKSSATNVEIHYAGAGAAHLGHVAGSLAHTNYLDPRLLAFNRPMPQELTPVMTKASAADMRFSEYLWVYSQGGNLTPWQLRRAENAVWHLEQWSKKPIRCCEVTKELIAEFLRDIGQAGKLGSSTINQRGIYLTLLWHAYNSEPDAVANVRVATDGKGGPACLN